jgi:hypothetical protein
VDLAFFLGAVAVVAAGAVTLGEAYDAIDWPIVAMLGCLIPVGELEDGSLICSCPAQPSAPCPRQKARQHRCLRLPDRILRSTNPPGGSGEAGRIKDLYGDSGQLGETSRSRSIRR